MQTRYPDAKSIFLQALELSTSTQREAYLGTQCGEDVELRREVDALLGHHDDAGSFLELPITAAVEAAEQFRLMASPPSCLDFLAPSLRTDSLGRLAHYEILEVVGSGGMGVVLMAFDEKLQRIVAIKAMLPALAASDISRRRFVREARAAAAINHDHVVDIYAVEEEGPVPYLVMEFIAGVSLEDRLRQSGPPRPNEILRIGLQTADGLAAAHRQGLVHRDVKPANILLESDGGRVKITDFGLARVPDDVSVTQTGDIAGTPAYMSPEQARGQAVDQRSDLFSLGNVLYAMCTGCSAFRADNTMAVLHQVCHESPCPIRESNPEIPEGLVAIIGRLLEKNTDARFQTAAEVAELLGEQLAQAQSPSLSPAAGEVSAKRRVPPRKRRWAIAAAALMCLFAGLSLSEATGVTHLRATVIRIFTPDGTLVVETDDPGVKVTVEGDGGIVITGAGPQEVHLKPGSYQVHAAKDGRPVSLDRELVTITRGRKQVVKVRLEAAAAKPAELREIRRRRWYGHHTYATAFSADSRYYAATGSVEPKNAARVWEVASGDLVMEVLGNECVVFTPDTKQLITAGPDKQLHVWEVPTGKELRRFGQHPDWISVLSLAPSGKQLLSGCNDGVMRLWDLASGEELARLDHHGQPCFGFFSPDSKRIVSVSARGDGLVRLWDAAEGKQLREWKTDSKTWWAQFAPDGRHFMTFADNTVNFWDSTTNAEPQMLQLGAGATRRSAFRPTESACCTACKTIPPSAWWNSPAANRWPASKCRTRPTVR